MNTSSFNASPRVMVATLSASDANKRTGAAKPSNSPTIPEQNFLFDLILTAVADKASLCRTLCTLSVEDRSALHRIMIKAVVNSRTSK